MAKTYPRANSVLTPPAQYTKLLTPRNGSLDPMATAWASLVDGRSLSDTEKAVLELLMFNGLRISEALRILPTDVTSTGAIRVRALKGSSDRLIWPRFNARFWLTNRLALPLTNSGFSRFYFYRLCNRYGFTTQLPGTKRQAVTHSFRHLLVRQLRSQGIEEELIQELLGHKSIKSTNSYGH